jgi:hypothetical protein
MIDCLGTESSKKNAKLERTMNSQNFTTTFTVDQTPEEVFAAITNVRGWWSGTPGVEGPTDKLGDEFTYRYHPYHYSKQKITKLIYGKKIVWRVVDSKLNFVEHKSEWTGTDIVFEISRRGEQTEVRFTHSGLTPAIECFDACSDAWSWYVKGSLRNLIAIGELEPKQNEGGKKRKAASQS